MGVLEPSCHTYSTTIELFITEQLNNVSKLLLLSHLNCIVSSSVSQNEDHQSPFSSSCRETTPVCSSFLSPLTSFKLKNTFISSWLTAVFLACSHNYFPVFARCACVCVCVYLNSPVQRGTGKLVVISGVDDNLHDIVSVSLKHLTAQPLSVPVPQLDQHVI